MPQKKKLSEPALRVLKTIADGNSVTGIRADLYEELRGLIGPNVPCLQNAILTPEGVAFLHAQAS
jgi:hypothetical protein